MSTNIPNLAERRMFNSDATFKITLVKLQMVLNLALALIALCCVAGMIYVGSQSKYIPYVVEVDKLGQVVAVREGAVHGLTDQRVLRYALGEFITDARTVTTDWQLQRKYVLAVYAHLHGENSPALEKMNEYYSAPGMEPQLRVLKGTVGVEIVSIIPQSDNTWQVDWTETHRDLGGVVTEVARWRALLEVEMITPTNKTSEEKFAENPFGIFVKDFSWSKELEVK